MYGLPDSAIVGTTRRVSRMARGKIVKTKKAYIEKESPAGEAFASFINKWANKRLAKQRRKALAKKHGVSFSD
jgi:hypothetical protein